MGGVFRVIVAGGHDFTDYEMLSAHLDKLLTFISMKKSIQVVCGGACGADSLGERYAKEHGYEVMYFPADWDRHGKTAGFKRNTQMAENADALVAFWDGNSRGTKHMIETAAAKGLAVRIKYYQKDGGAG